MLYDLDDVEKCWLMACELTARHNKTYMNNEGERVIFPYCTVSHAKKHSEYLTSFHSYQEITV